MLTTIFQNFIYENVYKNNVSLTITATGQKNEKALASNVRIRDIFVNGSEYDFTKIQLSDGWEYSTVDHLISAYEPTKPVSFNVNFDEDVRMLEIVYVQVRLSLLLMARILKLLTPTKIVSGVPQARFIRYLSL